MTKKKRRTFKEAYFEYSKDSFCRTRIIGGQANPKLVHITFKGSVARIPALKNQKIKGTNILRADSRAVLVLMTNLFLKSVNHIPPFFSEKLSVFSLVLCSYRKVAFDEDNVSTTIRDWLEPRMIRGEDREWGIGLVKNDRVVSPYAIRKTKTALNPDCTEIYLIPMEEVLPARDSFLSKIIGIEASEFKKMY